MSNPRYRLPPDYRAHEVSVAMAESLAWPWKFLGIEQVWERTRGLKPDGTPVKVAILDTGVDDAHSELVDQIQISRDFTGSRWGYADRNGHGTWCAGAVGARWRNNFGGAGIAPECRLIIAKVLGDDGSGDDRAIADGIEWAVAEGADILSMSFGGRSKSPYIAGALDNVLKQRKVFLFAAAGNDGGKVNYPGALTSTIGVGASDKQGRLTAFSSRGPELDVIAPGEEIVGCAPGGKFQVSSGTSMATPIVAGVAALAYALDPDSFEDLADMRAEMRDTASASGPWKLIDPLKLIASKGQIPVAKSWTLGPVKLGPVKVSLTVEAA